MATKQAWPAESVEQRPVADLVPYARNARTHSKEQVAKIAASIQEWGWTNPILVTETGMVIAGHGRLLAAQSLGIENAPCTVARGWTKAQIQAYVLADNQLALDAGWDFDALKIELGDLSDMDFDLGLIGFDVDELGQIMGLEGAGESTEVVEDTVPEVQETVVSVRGDVWLLGRHRVLCGDNADIPEAWKFDAVVTDPPYGIGVDRSMHEKGGQQYGNAAAPKRRYADTDWDHRPSDEFICALAGVRGQVIIFGGNYFALPPARGWLVWDKENGSNQFADCELAWTSIDQPVRIKHHMWNGMIRAGGEERNSHPTQKPVAVMAWCVEMTTGTILDPFLGSGTTLIAAESLNRRCFGIEISAAYTAVILQRAKDCGMAPRLEAAP